MLSTNGAARIRSEDPSLYIPSHSYLALATSAIFSKAYDLAAYCHLFKTKGHSVRAVARLLWSATAATAHY